jgi:hypothetical protein
MDSQVLPAVEDRDVALPAVEHLVELLARRLLLRANLLVHLHHGHFILSPTVRVTRDFL